MPDLDEKLILKAYSFAKKVHEGKFKYGKTPYILHPLSATYLMMPLKPDIETIIACILHDTHLHDDKAMDFIKKNFSEEVYSLVSDIRSLSMVYVRPDESQAETLRRMFLAMAKDLRVVFVKLADRLHDMMMLDHWNPPFKKEMVKQTFDVYAPIASRLGIYQFKSKLEDLCFKFLYPREYKNLVSDLKIYSKAQHALIESAVKRVKTVLEKESVSAEVSGREKHLYGIYNKLKRKGFTDLDELYDIYAIRVVLPDSEDFSHLYGVLGVIHSHFKPLTKRFKDYIAMPKANGYRSLHTVVVGLIDKISKPVEIQIRTKAMHEEAEYGIAAHWRYKEAKPSIEWLPELQQLKSENVKLDVFKDRIFVLTPHGDVKDLPQGATPVDFAYSVHGDVGNRCNQAKVDGRIVPLDYELQNGQVVEILTRKEPKPNRYWLSFVKTNAASNKIKNWFKTFDRESNLKAGRELLNKYLRRLHKPVLNPSLSLFKKYDGEVLNEEQRKDILESLGNGTLTVNQVLKQIFPESDLVSGVPARSVKSSFDKIPDDKKILVSGYDDLSVVLSGCCKPKYGQPIVGYVGRGKKIRIHASDCKSLRVLDDERFVNVEWKSDKKRAAYQVFLSVFADDRKGFLSDLTVAISSLGANISYISFDRSVDGKVSGKLIVEVSDYDQLAKILDKIEGIFGVNKVSVARSR
ncbi:MAG: guanosine polyphosphate pyrophosphohydrolase/synthetase, GTP pyrophosphokinase [Candidatus Peregrinibacteria bacterium GW2011_GWF2_43_17]|nr:MAG: guanosine polyphosphate pyrophosphohydrolase/synthetase, GTP pyrophosphokinase [Candidatus Peregrinibacteria bacterium GW2011_GWF2_43_17]